MVQAFGGQNREQRRHPPTEPRSIEEKKGPKLRIFAGDGQATSVTLGSTGETFHLARLTTAGVAEFQDFILNGGVPSVNGSSPGECIISGAVVGRRYDLIRQLLSRIIEEELPEYIEQESSPHDLITAVNYFFEESGMNFLAEMVKDLASAATMKMAARARLLVEEAVDAQPLPTLPKLTIGAEQAQAS